MAEATVARRPRPRGTSQGRPAAPTRHSRAPSSKTSRRSSRGCWPRRRRGTHPALAASAAGRLPSSSAPLMVRRRQAPDIRRAATDPQAATSRQAARAVPEARRRVTRTCADGMNALAATRASPSRPFFCAETVAPGSSLVTAAGVARVAVGDQHGRRRRDTRVHLQEDLGERLSRQLAEDVELGAALARRRALGGAERARDAPLGDQQPRGRRRVDQRPHTRQRRDDVPARSRGQRLRRRDERAPHGARPAHALRKLEQRGDGMATDGDVDCEVLAGRPAAVQPCEVGERLVALRRVAVVREQRGDRREALRLRLRVREDVSARRVQCVDVAPVCERVHPRLRLSCVGAAAGAIVVDAADAIDADGAQQDRYAAQPPRLAGAAVTVRACDVQRRQAPRLVHCGQHALPLPLGSTGLGDRALEAPRVAVARPQQHVLRRLNLRHFDGGPDSRRRHRRASEAAEPHQAAMPRGCLSRARPVLPKDAEASQPPQRSARETNRTHARANRSQMAWIVPNASGKAV
mmetsp:Transcript_6913/g.24583  ORF Transcript_6913/g.24583 Transcript_6913/m.24583 type:complete len:522 (-) Transcript_6913:24-1589(-)